MTGHYNTFIILSFVISKKIFDELFSK